MSKIFGIIAAVILAVSAFVAWKNQGAYQKEIDRLHTEQAEEKSTTQELEGQQKRLKDAEEAKDSDLAKNEEVKKDLGLANDSYGDAKKEVEALQETHKEKAAQIAEANDILKDLPNPGDLVPKVKRMQSQVVEAENGIATEEARLANLARQEMDRKARMQSLRQVVDDYTTGNSLTSLKTRINSIYRNWGFVILAGGDRQGVVSGSRLDVMRGGEVIGKLKVTAVETGRAAADIILDSAAEGITLQAGDTVVAERELEKPAGSNVVTAQ